MANYWHIGATSGWQKHLSQYEYSGLRSPELYYYRSQGGGEIDLILKDPKRLLAFEIKTTANIHTYELRSLESFLVKYPSANGIVLAPVTEPYQYSKKIKIVPWNYIA